MIEYDNGSGNVSSLSQEQKREMISEILSGTITVYGFGAVNYEFSYNWQFPFPYKAVFDNSPDKQSTSWNKCPVIAPEQLTEISPENCIIVIFPVAPARNVDSIRQQISSFGNFKTITWAPLAEWANNEQNNPDIETDHDKLLSLICSSDQDASLNRCNLIYDFLRQSGPLSLERVAEKLITPNSEVSDHICMLTDCLVLGGSERQLVSLVSTIKSNGKKIDLCIYNDISKEGEPYLEILQSNGVTPNFLFSELEEHPNLVMDTILKWKQQELQLVAWLLPVLMVQPFTLCYEYYKSTRPAVTIAYLDLPMYVCGMAGLLAGVPHIGLSARNYTPDHFPYFFSENTVNQFQKGMRFFTQFPQVKIYGNSDITSKSYADWIGMPEENIQTIPNGISPSFLDQLKQADRNIMRDAYGIGVNDILVLGVFRLSPEKNPLDFIKIVAELQREFPNLFAVICGVGPLHNEIEAEIKIASSQPEKIKLIGMSKNTAAWMKAADLLLHPSDYEGMPNVILEAQAAGLPVVSQEVGGIKSCLSKKLIPFMSREKNLTILTESCRQLLNDESREVWMEEVAQEIQQKFSAFTMSKSTLELFDIDLAK